MLDNIIENAHGDMRQVLNNLYLWSRGDKDLKSRRDDVKRDSSVAMKDIKGGAFDVTGLFFRAAPRKLEGGAPAAVRRCGGFFCFFFSFFINLFFNVNRAAPSRLGGRLLC
jgi:hypothetical protein